MKNSAVHRYDAPVSAALSELPRPAAAVDRLALELRFQVYCEECNFLPAENYPHRQESDEHDVRAQHFYDRDRGDLIGYVRLVPPDEFGELPFFRHCHPFEDQRDQLPRGRDAAEISRLMLRNDFRRIRKEDEAASAESAGAAAKRAGQRRAQSAQVLLRLYRQMYAWSLRHNVRYWYAAMERPLARALSASGFRFRQIGPEAEYYGAVAPYIADLRELETLLRERQPDLLDWMKQTPAITTQPDPEPRTHARLERAVN